MAPLPGWERAPRAFWRKALALCVRVDRDLTDLAAEAAQG